METEQQPVPVYMPGTGTIHSGKKIGTYSNGKPRFKKLCGTSRRDRHDPVEAPGREITCKRCLGA